MEIAKETLDNAKRSPCLAHSKSVEQLEASMDATQKFLDYVASCGPMLRGASKKKFLGKFARFGGFITDALVAVQADMMLTFTTHGGGMGRMQRPQVKVILGQVFSEYGILHSLGRAQKEKANVCHLGWANTCAICFRSYLI